MDKNEYEKLCGTRFGPVPITGLQRVRTLMSALALTIAMTASAAEEGTALPPDLADLPEQAIAPGAEPASAAPEKLASTVRSLDAFYQTIESKQAQIADLRKRFQAAADDVTRERLLQRLSEATREAEALDRQFESFAVGVDISAFITEEEQPFDWQEEIGGLVKPIVAELKSATAESRVIGDLRAAIEEVAEREQTAVRAVDNVESLFAAAPDGELRARLENDLVRWRQRHDDASNRRVALELQLENRLAERTSVLDQTTTFAKKFVRTRGLNLLLGIAAFFAVFLTVRYVGRVYDRMYSRRRGRTFSNRLGTLLFHIAAVIGGLGATLLVFNLAGDWFLLGILVIFLLGIGWASANTLPAHLETIKLMLNIGAVREGERIVFDGTPWQVDNLGFAARLVNPLLDGGRINLPVRYLVGMHSRPRGEDEEWFPCRQGDWVELSDGRFGKVAYQTPSMVQVVELGGAQMQYQTADFLALSPRNLSPGFRVECTFGIDYKHQADSTRNIPKLMQERLSDELTSTLGAEAVRHVAVELREAGASSLDYEIELDLDGSAAAELPEIRRAVVRILVEACNDNGWEIPFQQVTVHGIGARGGD